MGGVVKACEQCGSEWPEANAYCGACGHRLGSPAVAETGRPPAELAPAWRPPDEPTVVNVRVVNSFWDSCVSCFATVVGVIALVFVITWLISSC